MRSRFKHSSPRSGQPAELGFALNVPVTMSPRLDEEFPLDLLLK